MKIAVMGGVISTSILIEKLNEHKFSQVKVWAYRPINLSNISGWVDLELIAQKFNFETMTFYRLSECEESIASYEPDLLFVVGLSLIIPDKLINLPKIGSIGFHPTALPEGRGRAPISWLVLKNIPGAATFFFLRSGVDDGPIIVQKSFNVTDIDDANSVYNKLVNAEKIALDHLLTELKLNKLDSRVQDETKATSWGKRLPEDGWINWDRPASEIHKLVRASSHPHPGAYTHQSDCLVKIWCANISNAPMTGVIGRILSVSSESKSFIVQCRDGLIEITKWSALNWEPKVGMLFGYYYENEICRLRSEINILKKDIEKIKMLISSEQKE